MEYLFLLLFCSEFANSGALFYTEATRDGSFSRTYYARATQYDNCDPRGRLDPTTGSGGAWPMGPGCGVLSAALQWLSFAYYYGCTNVCARDYVILRRPTVYSYDTRTKNTEMTALFPRKSCVKVERCAHCGLKNGFAYGSCS